MKDRIGFIDRFKIDSLLDQTGRVTSGMVEVDAGTCKGCELCVKACPASALEIHEGKARMVEELPMCMSCGDCAALCPEGAIRQVKYISFSYAFRYLDRGEPSPPRSFI